MTQLSLSLIFMANNVGKCYFKMNLTISFKFLDEFDELMYKLIFLLAAISHLKFTKDGPGLSSLLDNVTFS